MQDSERIKIVKLLISRLERISADSVLAHKVSGIRGSLLRMIESTEGDLSQNSRRQLDEMIILASKYLEQACRDMIS